MYKRYTDPPPQALLFMMLSAMCLVLLLMPLLVPAAAESPEADDPGSHSSIATTEASTGENPSPAGNGEGDPSSDGDPDDYDQVPPGVEEINDLCRDLYLVLNRC
ncbi:MAG: hypothetical protein KAY24_16265 [Candidatus Eisenbacteria sp.]|nr:hypothetical protein [Candidatus Eisenbacteria bacterium]